MSIIPPINNKNMVLGFKVWVIYIARFFIFDLANEKDDGIFIEVLHFNCHSR